MDSETLVVEPQQRPIRRSPVSAQFSGIGNSLRAMFWWGLFLRVASIIVLHTYKVRVLGANFGFGWETGRIARAIALGQGFSNPAHEITGPTAWIAPIYPYLVAGVFKIFGIYTQLSAFVLLSINSVFSALTAIPVYLVAKKVFGPRVARWAGWTWALLPYTMYWAVRWIWETSLSALLVTVLFWLALELEESGRLRHWVWFGLLWGLTALTNPACLSFLPFAGGWICYRRWRAKKRWFTPAVLAGIIFIAVITPWQIRNQRTFHKFIFIRGNFGAELRMGNGPNAVGMWMWWLHFTQDPIEFEKYKRLGEVAYVAQRKQEAMDFIKQNPGWFLNLCARKAYFFWGGVPRLSEIPALAQTKNSLYLASSVLAFWGLLFAFVRRKRGIFLFTSLLLVYPATYYIVFAHPRYRHPIEPIILILGIYLISETREARLAAERNDALKAPIEENMDRVSSLSIVVPCYNEKVTIRHVIEEVMRAGMRPMPRGDDEPQSLPTEIVVVDDFSTDGTRDVLRQMEEDYRYTKPGVVKLVFHERNQGKGAAVRTGIQSATNDLVLIQDADLEYDPHDYPRLLEPILTGRADVVFGNRFHGGTHRVLYFWHYQANHFLTTFCNILTDLNLSDMEVGYKVFKREIFNHFTLKSNRFGFEPEVTIKTAKLGCRIYEVPVAYHGRTYEEGKKIGWKDGVAAICHMLKYRFFS